MCMVKWYEPNKNYFVKGKILKKFGKFHFIVLVNNKQYKRHANQLRTCLPNTVNNSYDNYEYIKTADDHKQTCFDQARNQPADLIVERDRRRGKCRRIDRRHSRPIRNKKVPDRLTYR